MVVSLGWAPVARVTFIEDAALLADAGGVGGLLRFRVRKAA
jgi:hypothetical protein